MGQVLVLQMRQAPGDTLALTAAARDLALAHPGRFDLRVATNAPSLWENNPHVRWAGAYAQDFVPGVRTVVPRYQDGLEASHKGERVHFVEWLRRDLSKQLGLEIPARLPHPDLHLSPKERLRPEGLPERYWVLAAGGKADMPAKMWPIARFQRLVDELLDRGVRCVRIGSTRGTKPRDIQPPLDRVVDLLDKTNLRQALAVIHSADGVICHNSFPMHAAAALGRPAVVLGGGREAPWWASYSRDNVGLVCPELLPVSHRFLHTVGIQECAGKGGCGKTHLRLEPGKGLCRSVLEFDRGPAAECQAWITVNHVLAAVMSYYDDGTLPPITFDPSWRADLDAPKDKPLKVIVHRTTDNTHVLDRLRETVPPQVPITRAGPVPEGVDYVVRVGPKVEFTSPYWWRELLTILESSRAGLVAPLTGPAGPSEDFHVVAADVLAAAGPDPTAAKLVAATRALDRSMASMSTHGGLVRA